MNTNDIRSNEQLEKYIEENGNPLFAFFYGGIYSQWYDSPFTVDGKKFLTAEHWMMYKKAETFNDEDIKQKILTVAHHPSDAKKLGREVKNFDPVKWAEVAFEYVVQGNVHKFSQNPEIRKLLLEKYDGRVLVEASPTDRIWGIGVNKWDAKNAIPVKEWKGTNLLGYAIMEARARLKMPKFVFPSKEELEKQIAQVFHSQTEQPKSEAMKLMDKYIYMEVDDTGKVVSQSPLVDVIFGEDI